MRNYRSLAVALLCGAVIALTSACGGAPAATAGPTSAPSATTSAAPVPTALASLGATAQPSPSASGGVIATPAATSTPAVTATPVPPPPTATLAPTVTPAPTLEATPSPTAAPTPIPATPSPTATAAPTPSLGADTATLDAPDEVPADSDFQIGWTGPNASQDYVSLVAAGATKWSGEQYFYTASANPGTLLAPTAIGDYELWYLRGADDAVLGRRPITVIAFVGSVSGPDQVNAGATFSASWVGPNALGDYVTIVAVGTATWTGESYFLTSSQSNTGTLIAPVDAGDYELWYAAGSDDKAMARQAIHVKPFDIHLDAPASVKTGRTFQVKWRGPDGPTDYITIVLAGSEPGTWASYA